MNPQHIVFHMVLEIVIFKILISNFERALLEIRMFHLRHTSAFNSENSQSFRQTILTIQKPA